MKVLVAEDDPVYRQVLRSTLAEWGYEAQLVQDGITAWQVLEGNNPPELVILGRSLPGLDGTEICRLIRDRARDRYTYLLLVSSCQKREDLVQALEAGADDYLSKPIDIPELRARLNTGRRILRLQNELIAAREAMRRQATRDALTGVYNHAAILEILDRELSRARRESKVVGIALADLDHFKRVNDTFGHLTGDAVLREVTTRAIAAMRPDDLIGRYGGEEFLLVLPGCEELATRKVCERIRQRVSETPVVHDGHEVTVTVSLGAVVFRSPYTTDAVGLVRAADQALYRAKAAGRNRVELAAGA